MAIPPLPVRNQKFLNPDGTVALPWWRWFQESAGTAGLSPADLTAILQELAALQSEIATLEAEIAGLTSSHIWAPTVGTPGRKPGSGEELFVAPISFSTSLPALLTGSSGGCEIAATADATFTLYKTGVSVGSVTLPAGLSGPNVAVYSFPSAQTFMAPTDTFSCKSPNTADATLSGVYFQFKGTIT